MWEFARENPICFAITVLIVCVSIESTVKNLWSRWMRSKNIRAQGWPPPYLDADGDSVPPSNSLFDVPVASLTNNPVVNRSSKES